MSVSELESIRGGGNSACVSEESESWESSETSVYTLKLVTTHDSYGDNHTHHITCSQNPVFHPGQIFHSIVSHHSPSLTFFSHDPSLSLK